MMIQSVRTWPQRVKEAISEEEYDLGKTKEVMQAKLDKEKETFVELLSSLKKKVSAFRLYDTDSDTDTDTHANDAYGVQNLLDEAVRKAADFGEREAVFGWQPTEWPTLREAVDEFTPHYTLWIIAADFQVNHVLASYYITSGIHPLHTCITIFIPMYTRYTCKHTTYTTPLNTS